MKFINRSSELESLNREYRRDGFAMTVIYGRRRVGKTRLIKEFIQDKKGIYFLADTQIEGLNLQKFKEKTAEFLSDDLLLSIELNSWESIIKYIVRSLGESQEKFVLAIDEFQYLVQINSSILSIFQRIIDELLQKSNCMLIICGSLISLMYSSVLDYSSPLYGRRTSQIKVRAFDFEFFSLCYPNTCSRKRVELYALLSGIPKYIELFQKDQDIFQSIQNNFLDQSSFFYQEPRFLLQEEVDQNKTFFSILHIIASGERKIGKISSKLGMETRNITSFLQKLKDLEIIERQVPVFETKPEKSKKGLYFIRDHFLRFWFAYIFPYSGDLEMGRQNYVLNKIKNTWTEYCSPCFEEICLEHARLNATFSVLKSGRHWQRDLEIDGVLIGDQDITFIECKWSNAQVGQEVYKDLQNKVEKLSPDLLKEKKLSFSFYSKAGFTQDLIETSRKEALSLIDFNK